MDTPTPEQISAMTPAEAGEALQRMAATTPATNTTGPDGQMVPASQPADARARLDKLVADREWGARFLSGSIAEKHEFADLMRAMEAESDAAGLDTASPSSQELFSTTANGELPRRHVEAFVADARLAGLSDGAIAQSIRGDEISASERAFVERLQRVKHNDPEWCRRLLAGGVSELREHKLMSIILSARIRP